ncbi:helix-turn-helix domain-containing protein [Nocardia huaxiensis]|uniref:Helix-turn-helix domain-containing protein n=1 Tax=Nocardia huaxiensis TaxID=2755382 RepID=A0A7D6VFG7_9NOCA|nr:helix-turn-helix domain-containing protein [Nocardia huaxiensis]QLY28370.1 helix-turn-helix domain-containing protein [Nocardia huaxiensis]
MAGTGGETMLDDHTVIGRTVAILDVVTRSNGPVTLAELTRRTRLPKSTVRRIANTLAEHQMLTSAPDGYLAGGRLIDHMMGAADSVRQPLIVQPYLQELHQRSRGELAWFATVENDELMLTTAVFDRSFGTVVKRRCWPTLSHLGSSIVLTASGRLQVAHNPEQADRVLSSEIRPLTKYSVTDRRKHRALLDRTRDTGVATEAEQVLLGWSCSAAAVRDAHGRMVAALGLIGRTGDTARSLAGQVLKLAGQLAVDLREPDTHSTVRGLVPNPPWSSLRDHDRAESVVGSGPHWAPHHMQGRMANQFP